MIGSDDLGRRARWLTGVEDILWFSPSQSVLLNVKVLEGHEVFGHVSLAAAPRLWPALMDLLVQYHVFGVFTILV